MKFNTYLSLMTLGASAAVARPLFRDNIVAERRHVPAPVVRRQEAEAVASEASAPAATAAPEAASAVSQAPFSYSTITNTAGFEFSGSTYSLSSSVSTSATTETQLPQATASASGNGNVNRNMNDESSFSSGFDSVSSFSGFNGHDSFNSNFNSGFNSGFNFNGLNGFDISNTAVITIREVQTVTQFVAVEVPVFLGVQVNNGFRENLFASQFSNLFQSRFDQWDINVINQLGFVLAQQYDFLTRASNHGFQAFNNDVFSSFLGKFGNQLNVFESFNLADVQQLLGLLQGFDLNQIASLFGRSDLLFSQDIFNQFGINNDFHNFVTQLPNLILNIQNGAFNNDGIFNLVNLDHNTLNFLQVV